MPRFGKRKKKPEYVTVGTYGRLTIDIMTGVIHLETPQPPKTKAKKEAKHNGNAQKTRR